MTTETRPQQWITTLANRWRTSGWLRAWAWSIAYQLAMTVLGRMFELSRSPWENRAFFDELLGHTVRWDGPWYEMIINAGYGADPSVVAFYPSFPALVALVQVVSFGLVGQLVIGFLINTVALAVSLRGLQILVQEYAPGAANERLAVLLLLSSPIAFIFHAFYTESLFLAISIWAFVFARRQLWWAMGVMLAISTATRLTGILVVGLCGLEYLRQRAWKPRRVLTPNLAWFLLAPLGFVSYMVVCQIVYGNPFAMIDNVRSSPHWPYHIFNPNIFETLYQETRIVIRAFLGLEGTMTLGVLFHNLFPLVALAILLLSSVAILFALRGDGVPLAGFGFAAFVMFLLNSNVRSVYRYVLVVFSIYIAAVLVADRYPQSRPVLRWVAYGGLWLQGWWYSLFLTDPQLTA